MSNNNVQQNKFLTKLSSILECLKKQACSFIGKYLPAIKAVDFASVKGFALKNKWRILALLLVVYAGSKAFNYFFPSDAKKGGAQTVTTALVAMKDLPITIESTGTIMAASIVDIRPMITNTVSKIHIKEGQEVKEGDLLFTLDDRNDKENYEKLKSLAEDAQKQYLRAKELVAKNFISPAGLDTSLANARSTQAAARSAEVQLSFDYIRSPITGRAGIINVFPGSLVQASNTVVTATNSTATSTTGAMVTISQLNPINVQFIIPEKDIGLLLTDLQNRDALKVRVTVGDNSKTSYEGKVLVIDNQVDPAIGAVRVKAQIPNDKLLLLPGQFARIYLQASTITDALIVPSQAVVLSPKGKTIYVVDKDNKVTSKPIKVIYDYQGISVISGVDSGERIVVEGKQNLRTGMKVLEEKAAPKKEAEATQTPATPIPEKK